MVDIEGVFQSLDEYLTGGVTNVGAAEHLAGGNDMPMMADEPIAEPFGPNKNIADVAYQHARQLNGRKDDRTVPEGQTDEEKNRDCNSWQ